MARVVIQQGHCFRRTGATGTEREQEFAAAVGRRLQPALAKLGHQAFLIGADDAVPSCDVFVALHTDGSLDRRRRGASVGYPPGSADSQRLARAWKAAHQLQGFPGGFLADNYTAALAGYYGFRRSNARHEFLAEHGTTTNAADASWLFDNLERCARAHVDAIGAIVGHPKPELQPLPMTEVNVEMPVLSRGARGHHVEVLQGVLNAWGAALVVDGQFGDGTDRSLRGWQGGVGLDQTGVTDSYTWEALLSLSPTG